MKALLVSCLLALGLGQPVLAGPDRISVLIGSRHFGGAGFDDRTPGLFLTWESRGGLDLSLGAYRNSYGRASIAATAGLPLARWDHGQISAFIGAAHYPGHGRNFRAHLGDVVPIGGLQLRHRNWFAQIMPSDGRPVRAVLSFGYSYSLGR